MKKAVTIAALASLALAANDFEDNNLSFIKTLGKDIKKAGQFVVQNPQIITTAAQILSKDDELTENELSFWGEVATDAKKASKFVVQHPELINTAIQILHKDSEISENELNFFKKIGNGLKKVGQFIAQHPQIITQATKILAHDDELMSIQVHKYLAENPEVLRDAINTVKKIDDDELFKCTPQWKLRERMNPKKPVKPVPLAEHDDEELFNLGGLIKDGANIYKDVKTHNYSGLITHGIQTVKDIKKHDDDEFILAGNGGCIPKRPYNKPIWGSPKEIRSVPVVQHDDDEFYKAGSNIRSGPSNPKFEKPYMPGPDWIWGGTESKPGKQSNTVAISSIPVTRYDDDEFYKAGSNSRSGPSNPKFEKPYMPGPDWIWGGTESKPGKQPNTMAISSIPVTRHDDEELFNLGGLIEDGFKISKDAKTHIYHGLQTEKEMKVETPRKGFLGHF